MKRILLAGIPGAIDVAVDLLRPTGEIVPVTTSRDARLRLTERFDAIMCGMLFEDSRMFDFLRYCKSDPKIKTIPFLSVRILDGAPLEDTFYQSIDIATKALGGVGFIDLSRWREDFGAEQAEQRLCALVAQLASDAPCKA
jgi:hypothetical protein